MRSLHCKPVRRAPSRNLQTKSTMPCISPPEDDPLLYLDDEISVDEDQDLGAVPSWALSVGHDAEVSARAARPSAFGHGGGPSEPRDKRREDTTGIPDLVDWEATRARIRGATIGGVAPRLTQDLTEEERDLLEMVLTGAVPTERRLNAADLPRGDGSGRRTALCPYCGCGKEEDAEHIYWWCTEWEQDRRPYLQAIESVIHRSAGKRRIRHYTEWAKATRTTMVFPEDPELISRMQHLEVQNVEVRERRREDWENEPRVDEMYEEGRLAVFTDGGCRYPEHPKIRRASYGIFYGTGHSWNFHAPFVGKTQTVARAELRAALWALEWAREPLIIVSDNLWTVNGIKGYRRRQMGQQEESSRPLEASKKRGTAIGR